MLEQTDDFNPGQTLWQTGLVLDERSLAAFIEVDGELGESGEEASSDTGFFALSKRPPISSEAKELADAIRADAALVVQALNPRLAQRLGYQQSLNTEENSNDAV